MDNNNLTKQEGEALSLGDIASLHKKSALHTMKEDVSLAIQKQNESIASIKIKEEEKERQIILAEQTKKEAESAKKAETSETAPYPVKRIILVFIFLLALVVGIFATKFLFEKTKTINLSSIKIPGFGTSSEKTASGTEPSIATVSPSLVPASTEKTIVITSERPFAVFSALSSELHQDLPDGSIKNIIIKEEVLSSLNEKILQEISVVRFFALAGTQDAGILSRSLEPSYMLGFVGKGDKTEPFLVLKTSGHDTGLIGMLEWERSLPKFFDIVFGTSIELTVKPAAKFRDVVILGRDARVLESSAKTEIAYTFADTATIVITTDKEALKEILSKLQ